MRVIGGTARSLLLESPKGYDTRPTADMVRESLFNILQRDIAGSRVLDLFAGTGALGIEALSRGAAFAAFVDSSKSCGAIIKRNLSKTGFGGRAAVHVQDAAAYICSCVNQTSERFDIVFADPPYDGGDGALNDVLIALADGGILEIGGLCVIERRKTETDLETSDRYERVRVKTYSNAKLIFMKRVLR